MQQVGLPFLIFRDGSFGANSFANLTTFTETVIELDLFFNPGRVVKLVFDYLPAVVVVSATPYFCFRNGRPV